jgi:hypothetical protein
MIAATALAVVVAGALLRYVGQVEEVANVRSDVETAVSPFVGRRFAVAPVATQKSGAVDPLRQVPVADRFAEFETVAIQTTSASSPDTRHRRRLVRVPSKYPFVRIEETLSVAPRTGVELLQGQLAMVADHVIVSLSAGHSRTDLEAAVARHGFGIRHEIPGSECFLVSTPSVTLDSVVVLIRALGTVACVDIVEPDYVVEVADTTPNDTEFSLLWGMNKIEIPRVWDMTTGSGDGVIAVFDTGFDLDHPDLAGNLWSNVNEIADNGLDDDNNAYVDDCHGWDFYSNDNDPTDGHGHGTHVSGTIGAVGNNGLGVAGVNWQTRIMPIKIFSNAGSFGTISDVVAGVFYVITHRIRGVPLRVTNHSWGGTGYNQVLRDALEIAGGQGIMHVAAAGNQGNLNNDATPHYPASFDLSNVLAVANTSESDALHYTSHYGATSVDLAAPGVGIESTLPGGYGEKSGTSMSCPHVTGVAAMMFGYMPELTWQEVRQAILDGVDIVPGLAGKCVTGGRLNAYGAFETFSPIIEHTPLDNTTDVTSPHVVEAVIRPSVPFVDTNRVAVLWNTTGSTNVFSTNLMQHVSNDLFRASIPPQLEGVAIYYMIRAESKTGLLETHPAEAPSEVHSFDVTYPVSMWVIGYPDAYGSVSPPYGEQTAAWGSTVDATADAYVYQGGEHRHRCTGWVGYGGAPPVGTANSVSFVIRDWTALQWMWQEQFALTQDSLPAGALASVSWWDTGELAGSVEAPATVDIVGEPHAFVNWLVDGERYPDAVSTAVNPATGLVMSEARQASAVFVPEAQDDDGDGLPDWWELFNFANLDPTSTNDPDADGYSNAEELADHSDPRDPTSIPEPPVIVHVPLDNPTGTLSPWRVSATVTDRVAVDHVRLYWQMLGDVEHDVAMTDADGDSIYEAEISGSHELGELYSYRIVAVDAADNESQNGEHSFEVAYPLASVAPESLYVTLASNASTDEIVMLANDGNAALIWQAVTNWSDSVEAEEGEWSHSGTKDQWHITTQEVHSGDYAWYCGDETFGLYASSQDASLVLPAVVLGAQPVFTFWHWAQMEYEGTFGSQIRYWDAGVVDISTNDGATFERIEPVGGYPHNVTSNSASPFAPYTPCFGETEGWELATFDLADYAGETVRIRFRFGSDAFEIDRGWIVDDVQFRWGASWMSSETPSGLVVPGASTPMSLAFDSSSLSLGDYVGALVLACNDPTQPLVGVPVVLRVRLEDRGSTISLAEDPPGAFVLEWPSETGNFYSVMLSTGLHDVASWAGVPGYTNLPGTEGTMSYTGAIDHIPAKFYRVDESQP